MTFQMILCPTDFSPASYEGLKIAVELARHGPTELCVVHVEQPTARVSPLAGIAPYARGEAERRAAAVANLCAVLEERVPVSVRARPLLKCGEAAAEVVRAACEENADLIVLATHGTAAAPSGRIGTVAEEILRRAPCPVLTLNAPVAVRDDAVDTTGSNGAAVVDTLRPQLQAIAGKGLLLNGD